MGGGFFSRLIPYSVSLASSVCLVSEGHTASYRLISVTLCSVLGPGNVRPSNFVRFKVALTIWGPPIVPMNFRVD